MPPAPTSTSPARKSFARSTTTPRSTPTAETLPLSEFEPMLRKVMTEPRNTIYTFEIKGPSMNVNIES
jgi:hypothetical protein